MDYALTQPMETTSVPIQHRFEPYDDNGGTSLAIAGKDFCIIASDTRQSTGYSINSRYAPKAYKLTETSVIAMNGFHADGLTLKKVLDQRLKWYKFNHDKDMSVTALAQMLSITLYQKRFFPYYSFCVLGGVDDEGRGAVYAYDAIGSFEREKCRANGSASALIQPFLDNQVSKKNMENVSTNDLELDEAIRIAKDAFTSATERDIYTGDSLEIFIIRKGQPVEVQLYPLKKD
ncbi:nucleophile aminohydrolase [Choanephora cucurbitarum]|nr:nucleophile aminohydrolase [Choanephora cucurbitarum]